MKMATRPTKGRQVQRARHAGKNRPFNIDLLRSKLLCNVEKYSSGLKEEALSSSYCRFESLKIYENVSEASFVILGDNGFLSLVR